MRRCLTILTVWVVSMVVLAGCASHRRPTALSLDQLIAMLQDPYSDFPFVVSELAKMGPAAAPAAPDLARALQYPRRDSSLAGEALVAMGPAARSAIPELIEALASDRADVRLYAAFVLGTIGESAKCAVPELARRLWDTHPAVRTAAAGALDAITGIDLVDSVDELNPALPGSVVWDEPEATITGKARTWWEEGRYMDWSDDQMLCDPDTP